MGFLPKTAYTMILWQQKVELYDYQAALLYSFCCPFNCLQSQTLSAVDLQTAWRTHTSVLLNNEQTTIQMGCRFSHEW